MTILLRLKKALILINITIWKLLLIVRSGAITHTDNQGNKGRTVAGDIQVMSAGHRRYSVRI
jgi:hypothetical protein